MNHLSPVSEAPSSPRLVETLNSELVLTLVQTVVFLNLAPEPKTQVLILAMS